MSRRAPRIRRNIQLAARAGRYKLLLTDERREVVIQTTCTDGSLLNLNIDDRLGDQADAWPLGCRYPN